MRVLVAGGAGFIGSTLCRHLLAAGHRVDAVDNHATSDPARRGELARLGVRFTGEDVVDTPDGPYDLVYHLASPASPVHYRRLPLETIWANVLGTRRLLEVAGASGARFVLASTSEVYGDPLVHPQTEEYWGNVNPVGERACYDEAKRLAETITMATHRAGRANVGIARIFNTYGPGMAIDDGRAVPAFIVAALRGEPMLIQGDGRQTRSFCYVDDTVAGLTALGTDRSADGLICNIGSPDEITIMDLVELIRELTGNRSDLLRTGPASDDPRRRRPDISRMRERYGWEPATPLREGLARTTTDLASRLGS